MISPWAWRMVTLAFDLCVLKYLT